VAFSYAKTAKKNKEKTSLVTEERSLTNAVKFRDVFRGVDAIVRNVGSQNDFDGSD
jgi:hypothetical protein